MECEVAGTQVHYIEHGEGTPVLILHGAGVDHREVEACFEPILDAYSGLRRVYPDLPGMGRTTAPATVASADDVLDLLLDFTDAVLGDRSLLVIGHSAGGYYAQGFAARRPDRVAGLALVCPLLDDVRDVPDHHAVVGDDSLGDDEFRGYFVVQTPAMLERYERFVAAAVPLSDPEAMERIGRRWQLTPSDETFAGPTLVIAGRQDSTVGYTAAVGLLERCPRSTLAVLEGTGHALPHEKPAVLGALISDWLEGALAD